MSGISKSQVSSLCAEIDGKIRRFLERPVEGDRPCLPLDAMGACARWIMGNIQLPKVIEGERFKDGIQAQESETRAAA